MAAPSSAAALFRPLTFAARSPQPFLSNRIVMAPMCQYSVETKDGHPSSWHQVHYGARALGGAGAIVVEATSVLPNGRISPHDLGIWDDSHVESFKQVTSFVHQYARSSKIGIQLAHAGRKASTARPWNAGVPGHFLTPEEGGWPVVAPSAIPFNPSNPAPIPLTTEEIADYVKAWVEAAKRAVLAGFDFIEIHAAHGYLLHQFCSPISNHRTDIYGAASLENRTRFCREVVQAVRQAIPESMPLWVRLSCSDFAEEPVSWNLQDTIALCKDLKTLGADLIDCSGGGLTMKFNFKVGPGYQVPFADAVRAEAGIATGAVGLITESNQANEIIESGKADVVLLGRQLLRDPSWPLLAAHQLKFGAEIPYPSQYAYSRRA